jgi:hypothetical protein
MKSRASWLVLPLLLAGCMEGQKQAPEVRRPSLYTQLGGAAGLEKIVDRLATRGAGAPELSAPVREAFREPDERQKERLVRQLGAALGGPYHGTLADLRKALVLSEDEEPTPQDLDVLLRLLDGALTDSGVGPRLRQETMTALGPLRNLPAGQDD